MLEYAIALPHTAVWDRSVKHTRKHSVYCETWLLSPSFMFPGHRGRTYVAEISISA